MLTLLPGSSCDVCAEEYGLQRQPHSIPCGHVLCASCSSTIVEKTSSRLTPVCPFCRESFTSDSVRLIRTDFPSSGWSTPRRLPAIETNTLDFSDLWTKRTERLLSENNSRARQEARRLEDKVARVAAKKCSVEEVSSLHKELEAWLTNEVTDDQTSLYLSAALLRAILMNHLAHSEASRNAKAVEANLKGKLDDVEETNEKLESELRKQRTQYNQKAQECQTMWTELSRLRALATTLGTLPELRQSASSPPPTPSTSPVPPYTPSPSQLSRFNSVHARSASMSSRPSTPATPSPMTRSHTPGPPLRSQTPSVRSHTPSIRSHAPTPRSYTPALPMRHATPGPTSLRLQTPAPPPIPPKPRRLSTPSPPKMMRSASEEKSEVHERWFPPVDPGHSLTSGKPYKYTSTSRPPSRTTSYSSSIASMRYRSPSPA